MTPNLKVFILFLSILAIVSESYATDLTITKQTDKETMLNEYDSPGLNSIINKIFQSFFLKQDIGDVVKSDDKTLEENIIAEEGLQRFNYAADRNLKIQASEPGAGAELRVLDKIYGTTEDLTIYVEQPKNFSHMDIYLKSCLYNKDDLFDETLALIEIKDIERDKTNYKGWISSKRSYLTQPDNYRYRFWLLRCII